MRSGLCSVWPWARVGGEMGLARPDLSQAWARSGLDLFIPVQINILNLLFETEGKHTGSFYSGAKETVQSFYLNQNNDSLIVVLGAASMEVLPE